MEYFSFFEDSLPLENNASNAILKYKLLYYVICCITLAHKINSHVYIRSLDEYIILLNKFYSIIKISKFIYFDFVYANPFISSDGFCGLPLE